MRKFLIILFVIVAPMSALGQYFHLGTSPSSIRWNSISSGGNKYIFSEDYQSQAVRFMHYIDTIRPHISYGFKYGPLKLPIVMQPQNFASNGMVMLAPRRMELMGIPHIDAFSEPWLKQLATHEYRHAVQLSNMNRGFVKAFGYIFGQQGSLLGSALMPMWVMEGDATLAETQFSTYGRGLQPSFTIQYRAMADQLKRVPTRQIDKWFCGSYKDFVPSHYHIGYQITSYAYHHYGVNVWEKVANYATKYPYTFLTMKIPLTKYYNTSSAKLFRATFDDLCKFWDSQPKQENSARIVPTPITSYTTYSSPMPIDDNRVIVLKTDLDRTDRFVEVDLQGESERTLFHTGNISTKPTMSESGRVFWSEYRTDCFWDLKVNSQLRYFDISEGKARDVPTERQALYPTPMPDGRVAVVNYNYNGSYSVNLLDSDFKRCSTIYTFPNSLSIHGLAYDDQTRALYYIALGDQGMSIGSFDDNGRPITVKPSAYITIGRLRASSGSLYFNSIESGLDEVHMYDLSEGKEYRISTSTYGSFDPMPFADGQRVAMTTYDSQGYKLSVQRVAWDSLPEVSHSTLPRNKVNPVRAKWNVPNIDLVIADTTTVHPVKRYRKGLNVIDVHSWAPFAFDPGGIVGERTLDMNIGATIMSQNLLNSAIANLSYAWTEYGSTVRGGFTYTGLVPKIDIRAEYSERGQIVFLPRQYSEVVTAPNAKGYLDVMARVYLPLRLSSGYHVRYLQPSIGVTHNNALLFNPVSGKFERSLQKLTSSIQYTDNVRTAPRNLQPRWGYAVAATSVINPFSDTFGRLWSLYGRGYVPGIAANHGIMLRGAYQWQTLGMNNYRQKELFPRGAEYNFTPKRYGAASFDYRMPLWYPDMGINSILYFKRISAGLGFDYAQYTTHQNPNVRSIYSYGGNISFDMNFLRTPSFATTTMSLSVFKPSDRNGVVVGVNFAVPL